MRHETKKICKIVDEMTTYFLKEDTDEVDFKIKKSKEKTVVKIIDYNTHYTENDVQDLKECLNVQRQHEVEEYYWQLVGESDTEAELTIVGVMIDEATVELVDGNLHVTLVRYK